MKPFQDGMEVFFFSINGFQVKGTPFFGEQPTDQLSMNILGEIGVTGDKIDRCRPALFCLGQDLRYILISVNGHRNQGDNKRVNRKPFAKVP